MIFVGRGWVVGILSSSPTKFCQSMRPPPPTRRSKRENKHPPSPWDDTSSARHSAIQRAYNLLETQIGPITEKQKHTIEECVKESSLRSAHKILAMLRSKNQLPPLPETPSPEKSEREQSTQPTSFGFDFDFDFGSDALHNGAYAKVFMDDDDDDAEEDKLPELTGTYAEFSNIPNIQEHQDFHESYSSPKPHRK